MKRIILSMLLCFIAVSQVFSQTTPYSLTQSQLSSASPDAYNITVPQLLPASPEPAAFVKSGVGNVNLSTGAASVDIPLYEIKIKDFSFPISLSYSTQGLKVDEASSRVGYGWVLNANGMITRSVKGQPDELATPLATPANLNANTDPVYTYALNASDPQGAFDTQADEFQFNVNGYSGKFVIDSNNVVRVTSKKNIKVTANSSLSAITLITPDGVKYSFGSVYEQTTTHNVQEFSVYKAITKTAFFLTRIDLPTNEVITFNYVPVHILTAAGVSQTLQLNKTPFGYCDKCSQMTKYSTQNNNIEYDTYYLSSIATTTGLNIAFQYVARPDMSNDPRLKSLTVAGLKRYTFDYYDRPSLNTRTCRFFLVKLSDQNMEEGTINDTSHDYVFKYDQMENTPLPGSYNQDYLGFYNNRASYLIPASPNGPDNTMDFSFRNPDWNYSKMGTLTSVQYPTGGREEYIYEANTTGRNVSTKRNTKVTVTQDGNGGTSGWLVYNTVISDVKRNQTATISAYADDAILNDGHTADPTHNTVVIKLFDGTTLIASRSVLGYASTSTTADLVAGHQYRLEMTVKYATERGTSSITYDTASQDYYDMIYTETQVPGVRVKQIQYTDLSNLSTHSKYYTYAALDKLEVSTGSCLGGMYATTAQVRLYCDVNMAYPMTCNLEVYSSNSALDAYGYAGSGSVIYYKTVIESDDAKFRNGGTEYTFYDNDDGGNHFQILGSNVPFLPNGQYPTLSGTLYKTRVFNKDKQVVQEQQDDYETLTDMSSAVYSYYVRKRYDASFTEPNRMDAFDIIRLQYNSSWIRLKTKTVKQYAGGTSFTQMTNYTYGTDANIQPVTVTTTDSKGVKIKTENKYPTDFTTDVNYNKLVNKNQISLPVQESSYRNDTLLQQKKTIYKDWYNDSKIVMPEIIQVKQSPTDVLHNELVYERYDKSGNPSLLSLVNNIHIVYIWDTVHSLPLAEVKNAVFDQVAYTGFEIPSHYGNWQLSSGTTSATAFTGNYSFTGTLAKSIATAGTYKVSLWTNSTVTVNGATGTQTRSNRGWKLLEWTLVNPSTITVAGTNMDEVRLCPKDAQMTTYTYIPFVGASSLADATNNVSYYQYDGYNRLKLVKDQDYNILKQYSYKYVGPIAGTTYYNSERSQIFTKNNCSVGLVGNEVTYTVPANTYVSLTSKSGADSLAQVDINTNGQNYANGMGACLDPATLVTITSSNTAGTLGFTAVYTNVATGVQKSFPIPSSSGVQTLGTLQAGTYNVTISNSRNTAQYNFSVCANLTTNGTKTVTFNNVVVNDSACNRINIDPFTNVY